MADPQDAERQQILLGTLSTYLVEAFGCHTAVLYGSRARGDWDDASDIDVIAFRDEGDPGHMAHRWQGLFLDLFLCSTDTRPESNWLRLHGGRVLFQRDQHGDRTLSAVEAMFAAGPEHMSANELQTLRLWCEKMLARAEKHDPEGDYRRHWLLMTLLENYFVLRGQWYLGPKRSLYHLRTDKPADFEIFCKAFEPSASLSDIRIAVTLVIATEK